MNTYSQIIVLVITLITVVVLFEIREPFIIHMFGNAQELCLKYPLSEEVIPDCNHYLHDGPENVTNTLTCPESQCWNNKGNPKYLYHPTTLKDVKTILSTQHFGKTVRVHGGTKFNDKSYTKDVIIRTINLNKVLNVDKENKTVTVESGMLVIELLKELHNHGLSLEVIPKHTWKSVGSAISGADHGYCSTKGSISSLIKDITVVLDKGLVKRYTKKDSEFKALTCGLGSLAFIYSVTFQCTDSYKLEETEYATTWDDICANIELYLKSHSYLSFNINPYTLECSMKLRKMVPITITNRLINTTPNSVTKYVHEMIGLESKQKDDVEFGVDYKYFSKAIVDVIEILQQCENHENEKMFIDVHFSGRDKYSYLSPCGGRLKTCWIGLQNCSTNLLELIENTLVLKYRGRSVYDKKHNHHEQKMINLYQHNFRDFQKMRNKIDSERIFTNDYMKNLLGM